MGTCQSCWPPHGVFCPFLGCWCLCQDVNKPLICQTLLTITCPVLSSRQRQRHPCWPCCQEEEDTTVASPQLPPSQHVCDLDSIHFITCWDLVIPTVCPQDLQSRVCVSLIKTNNHTERLSPLVLLAQSISKKGFFSSTVLRPKGI